MTIIRNATVINAGSVIENASVGYENGLLTFVPTKEKPTVTVSPADTVTDAGGAYLCPGFIDIHTHGGGGYDFLDGTREAFLGAAEMHARHGTTTLLPTATSGTFEETAAMLRVYEEAEAENKTGADMPGVHLEGPYFSLKQCGAQDPRFVRAPQPEEYLRILDTFNPVSAEGHRKVILRWSAAPELEGTEAFAKACLAHGVLPSIGHSDADYDEVRTAFANGFTHITHLYSCMSTVHRKNAYRHGGIVEAAYLTDGMTSEIIADGVHLPAELLQMVYRFIGSERVALITDSMRGAGMPEGKSILGSLTNGMEVIIEDGVAKLPDRSAFAGSVATTDRLVRTMVRLAGVPLADAVRMASETPASVMGFTDRGSLAIGKRADLVLLSPVLETVMTVVAGNTVFQK